MLTLYLHQLLDVAHGVTYLHYRNLVHGNLTGVSLGFPSFRDEGELKTLQHNILVGTDGVARISDYGLELVLRGDASSKSIPTNVRWMAPEVLGAKSGHVPSVNSGKAADLYSFAVVMFEVCLPCLYACSCISTTHACPDLDGYHPVPGRGRGGNCEGGY